MSDTDKPQDDEARVLNRIEKESLQQLLYAAMNQVAEITRMTEKIEGLDKGQREIINRVQKSIEDTKIAIEALTRDTREGVVTLHKKLEEEITEKCDKCPFLLKFNDMYEIKQTNTSTSKWREIGSFISQNKMTIAVVIIGLVALASLGVNLAELIGSMRGQ